jgi:hypothetical protein
MDKVCIYIMFMIIIYITFYLHIYVSIINGSRCERNLFCFSTGCEKELLVSQRFRKYFGKWLFFLVKVGKLTFFGKGYDIMKKNGFSKNKKSWFIEKKRLFLKSKKSINFVFSRKMPKSALFFHFDSSFISKSKDKLYQFCIFFIFLKLIRFFPHFFYISEDLQKTLFFLVFFFVLGNWYICRKKISSNFGKMKKYKIDKVWHLILRMTDEFKWKKTWKNEKYKIDKVWPLILRMNDELKSKKCRTTLFLSCCFGSFSWILPPNFISILAFLNLPT